MKLITAIVRPEKVMDVIKALEQEGYFAFSKWAISGRGKEKGIQVGDVLYQEMAKNMLYITVGDKEKDEVVDIIIIFFNIQSKSFTFRPDIDTSHPASRL